MLKAAARALAELAREDVVEEVERAYGKERFSFGPEYLLPKPIDPGSWCGSRRRWPSRRSRRASRAGPWRPAPTRRASPSASARGGRRCGDDHPPRAQRRLRVVFSEGTSETILRASAILAEEGIASPILLGRESEVREAMERLRLGPGAAQVVEPLRSPRYEGYVDEYFGCAVAAGSCGPSPRSAFARRTPSPP